MRKIVWTVVALACMAAFALDLVLVELGAVRSLDRNLELEAHGTLGGRTLWLFKDLSDVGGTIGHVVLVACLLVLLFWRRHSWLALLIVVSNGGADLVETILKVVVRRPRPHLFSGALHASGFSFPSGHATDSASLGLMVAFVAWLLWRGHWTVFACIVAAAYSLLVGLSRVVLGVHYPSDVVAGWLLGCGWDGLCIMLLLRWWPSGRVRGAIERASTSTSARSGGSARSVDHNDLSPSTKVTNMETGISPPMTASNAVAVDRRFAKEAEHRYAASVPFRSLARCDRSFR